MDVIQAIVLQSILFSYHKSIQNFKSWHITGVQFCSCVLCATQEQGTFCRWKTSADSFIRHCCENNHYHLFLVPEIGIWEQMVVIS